MLVTLNGTTCSFRLFFSQNSKPMTGSYHINIMTSFCLQDDPVAYIS